MAASTRASILRPIGTAILDQIVAIDARSLSPATAQELLAIRFNAQHRARVRVLSAKARESRLGEAEQDELDEYLHVADLLAILHSKARQALKNAEKGL
jgi:hypothetical protein